MSTSPPLSDNNYQPKIISNPDGTYTRLLQFPIVPASPDPTITSSSVLTKDIPIDPTKQTWFRIFLPLQTLLDYGNYSDNEVNKLPLIFYYHGGGFVFVSAGSVLIHDFCTQMAAQLNVIVISVDYRLAPEYRLPAAYDDAIEALFCAKSTQEDWLRQFADFSNCFLMGTSAGGNIAYHAGLRACSHIDNLVPLKIKGLVLHDPFFGGSNRTGSELRIKDGFVTLQGSDLMWELALPVGADRDHEYSNPMIGSGSNGCKMIRKTDMQVLVTGRYGDMLIDRQIEFANMLEEKGVEFMARFDEGYHSMELIEPSKAEELFMVIKKFMCK